MSADNPAVTTVLELTDANCVPSNQNITVRIETRGSVKPQLYARDLAITAVICFSGEDVLKPNKEIKTTSLEWFKMKANVTQ